MSTINVSKHSYEKCLSPITSTRSLDDSDVFVGANDINSNSYVNTPSSSSIASSSSIDHPRKSRLKSDCSLPMSSKHRVRFDKLFQYTHSVNRQYVINMTNILFQMQKEIYRLRRRTHHVEQKLNKQTQSGQPIIRIPRLTKSEISTICVNNNQENNIPLVPEENNDNNQPSSPIPTMITEASGTIKENIENSTNFSTTNEANIETNISSPKPTQIKYCTYCNRNFSHRSAYLRHMRNKHRETCPSTPDDHTNHELIEDENSLHSTCVSIGDQDGEKDENESAQVLVNQWDVGEGRLRPRPAAKAKPLPNNKIKCDICNKFFRTEYINKHKRRYHDVARVSTSSELNDASDETKSTPATRQTDENQSMVDESPSNSINPPSTITIAAMDVDDIPIEFRKESNKPIVIVTTCLDRYQMKFVDEFLQKFSSRVSQTLTVDSRTTHLITNDDERNLYSPLSMRLIEGIANHVYCVSYRWLIDCLKYDRIIDENSYEIEADNTEYRAPGGPRRARLAEKRNSLFENVCFMIKCEENNDIRMTNRRLQDLILTCGGRIITCVTQNHLDQFQVVVLCDRTYVSQRRHNYDQCRLLGIHFVSSDWILESILEYQQKSISAYEQNPSE